jgi:hypothetical protein
MAAFSLFFSRVEDGRGGCESLMNFGCTFVHSPQPSAAVAPFPVPAHRTQHAVFPHYALRLASRGGIRQRGTGWRRQLRDLELAEDRLI